MNHTKLLFKVLIVGLILILFYTLSIQKYGSAMITVFGLVLLILCLTIASIIPTEQQNSTVFGIGVIIALMLYGWMMLKINNMVIDYAFKNKAQQQFCGIIQREYSKQMSRGSIYFWHVENQEHKQTFDFRKHEHDNLKIGQHICITYAIDTRWQNTPYIYNISQEKTP